jgi:hypothetical protein
MWITQQNSYAGWKIASGGFAALTTLDSESISLLVPFTLKNHVLEPCIRHSEIDNQKQKLELSL